MNSINYEKCLKKNALTAALSLACLKMRSRNEEVINSSRNRIHSLKNAC